LQDKKLFFRSYNRDVYFPLQESSDFIQNIKKETKSEYPLITLKDGKEKAEILNIKS